MACFPNEWQTSTRGTFVISPAPCYLMFSVFNKWHKDSRFYSFLHLYTSLFMRCQSGWKQHQITGRRDANNLPDIITGTSKGHHKGHGWWSSSVNPFRKKKMFNAYLCSYKLIIQSSCDESEVVYLLNLTLNSHFCVTAKVKYCMFHNELSLYTSKNTIKTGETLYFQAV